MDICNIKNKTSHLYHNRSSHPKYEIADIFKRYLPAYFRKHKLSPLQYKAVNAIMSCRTSQLGYHKYKCEECGYEKIEYNSCRNRHCPKCQGYLFTWGEVTADVRKVFHRVKVLPTDSRYQIRSNEFEGESFKMEKQMTSYSNEPDIKI